MTRKYLKRCLESQIIMVAQKEPVTILTGARQVGKSTLLENLFPDWRMISLDDFDLLKRVQDDPEFLLRETKIIIDEVQRAPKLLQVIKQAVDRSNRSCRYVLTGSANLLLMNKASESLAGRAVICNLRPFTIGEREGRAVTSTIDSLFKGLAPEKLRTNKDDKMSEFILNGWMPVIALEERTHPESMRWYEGYVTSYLEKDLRSLSQIDSLSDFKNLMKALALRSGQILNQTEIGRDVTLKQPTAHRYINILESSLLLERLPAYSVNRTKRLIKAPKPYYIDSGLAAYLAGVSSREEDEKVWAALVETAVLHHLRVWGEMQTPKANIYYWRTVSGDEVDFVIEMGRHLVAIEVKATSHPKHSHADALKTFMNEYPNCVAAAVVHLGDEMEQLGERIFSIPLRMLF